MSIVEKTLARNAGQTPKIAAGGAIPKPQPITAGGARGGYIYGNLGDRIAEDRLHTAIDTAQVFEYQMASNFIQGIATGNMYQPDIMLESLSDYNQHLAVSDEQATEQLSQFGESEGSFLDTVFSSMWPLFKQTTVSAGSFLNAGFYELGNVLGNDSLKKYAKENLDLNKKRQAAIAVDPNSFPQYSFQTYKNMLGTLEVMRNNRDKIPAHIITQAETEAREYGQRVSNDFEIHGYTAGDDVGLEHVLAHSLNFVVEAVVTGGSSLLPGAAKAATRLAPRAFGSSVKSAATQGAIVNASASAKPWILSNLLNKVVPSAAVKRSLDLKKSLANAPAFKSIAGGLATGAVIKSAIKQATVASVTRTPLNSAGISGDFLIESMDEFYADGGTYSDLTFNDKAVLVASSIGLSVVEHLPLLELLGPVFRASKGGTSKFFQEKLGSLIPTDAKSKDLLDKAVNTALDTGDISPVAEIVSSLIDRAKLTQLLFRSATARSAALASSKLKEQAGSAAISTVYGVGEEIGIEVMGQVIGNIGQHYGLGLDQNILDIEDTVNHLDDLTLSSLILYSAGFVTKGTYARAFGEGHTMDDLVADAVTGDFTTRFKDIPLTPETAKAINQITEEKPVSREVETLSVANTEAMGLYAADRYADPTSKGIKPYNVQVESEIPNSLNFSQPQTVTTVERPDQDTTQAMAEKVKNEMPSIAFDSQTGRYYPTKYRDAATAQGMAKNVLRVLFDVGYNERNLFSTLQNITGKSGVAVHPSNAQNYSRSLTGVEAATVKQMLGTENEITEYVFAGESSGLPVTTTIHGSAAHKEMEDLAGAKSQQYSTVGLNKTPLKEGGKRLVIANPTRQQLEIKAKRSRGSKGVIKGTVFSVSLQSMFEGSKGGVMMVPADFELTKDMLPEGWKATGEVSMPDSRVFKNSSGSKAIQIVANNSANLDASESRNLELSAYKSANASKYLPIIKKGKVVGWTNDIAEANVTSFADMYRAVKDALRSYPVTKPAGVTKLKFALAKQQLNGTLMYLEKAYGIAKEDASDFYSKHAKISDRNIPVEALSKIFGEALSDFYQTPIPELESGVFNGQPILVRSPAGKVVLNTDNKEALVSYMYDAVTLNNNKSSTGDLVVSEQMVQHALNFFIYKDATAPPEVSLNSKLNINVEELRMRYAVTEGMSTTFLEEMAESSLLNSMIEVYPELRRVQAQAQGHSRNDLIKAFQKFLVPFKDIPVDIRAYFSKYQSGMFFNNNISAKKFISTIGKAHEGALMAVVGSKAFGSTHPIDENNSAREQLERVLADENSSTHLIIEDAARLIQEDPSVLGLLEAIKDKKTNIVTISSTAYNGPVGLLHDLIMLTKPRDVRLPKSFTSKANFIDKYAEAGDQVTKLGDGASVWTISQSAVGAWPSLTALVPHISNIVTSSPIPDVIQTDGSNTPRDMSLVASQESRKPIMDHVQSIMKTLKGLSPEQVVDFARSTVEGGRDLTPKVREQVEDTLKIVNTELNAADVLPTYAKPLSEGPNSDSAAVARAENAREARIEGITSKARATIYKQLNVLRTQWETEAPEYFRAGEKGNFVGISGAPNKAERIDNQRKKVKLFLEWHNGLVGVTAVPGVDSTFETSIDPFLNITDPDKRAAKLTQLIGLAQQFEQASVNAKKELVDVGEKAKQQVTKEERTKADNAKDKQVETYIGAINHLKLIQIQDKLATLVKDPTTNAIYIPVPLAEHKTQSPTNVETRTTQVNSIGMLLRYAPDFIPGVQSIEHKFGYSVAMAKGKKIIIGTPAKIRDIGSDVVDGAKLVLTHPRLDKGYHKQVKGLIDTVSAKENSQIYPLANQALFGLETSMYESMNYGDPSKNIDPVKTMGSNITAGVQQYAHTLTGAEPQTSNIQYVEPLRGGGSPVNSIPTIETNKKLQRVVSGLATIKPDTQITIGPEPTDRIFPGDYISPATKEGPTNKIHDSNSTDGMASRSFGPGRMTKQGVKDAITERFGGIAENVKVVDTVADVPSKDIQANDAGYWLKANENVNTNTIYLVAENIAEGDAVNVLLHEVIHELVYTNNQSPNSSVIDSMIDDFLTDPVNAPAVAYLENSFGPDMFRRLESTERLAYIVQVVDKLKAGPNAHRTLREVAKNWVKNIARVVLNAPFEPSIEEVVHIANEFSTVKVMHGLGQFSKLSPAKRQDAAIKSMAMIIGLFNTSNTQTNYYGIDKYRGAGTSIKKLYAQHVSGLTPLSIAKTHNNDAIMAGISLVTSKSQRRRADLSNIWNNLIGVLDKLTSPQRHALGAIFNESTTKGIPFQDLDSYKKLTEADKSVLALVKSEYDRTAKELYNTFTGLLHAISVTTDVELAKASSSLVYGDIAEDTAIVPTADETKVANIINGRVLNKNPNLERGTPEYADAFQQEQDIYAARLKSLGETPGLLQKAQDLLQLVKVLESDTYAPIVRRGGFVLTYVKPPTDAEVTAAALQGGTAPLTVDDVRTKAGEDGFAGSAGLVINRYDTKEALDKARNILLKDKSYIGALRNKDSINVSLEYENRQNLNDNPAFTDLQVGKITELLATADSLEQSIPGISNAVRSLSIDKHVHLTERTPITAEGGEIDLALVVRAYAKSMTNAQVQLESGEELKELYSPLAYINQELKIDGTQDHMRQVADNHETNVLLPARQTAEEMLQTLQSPDLPGDFGIYKKYVESNLQILEQTQAYLNEMASAPNDTAYNQVLLDWEAKTLDFAKVVKAAESGTLDNTARQIGRGAFIAYLAFNPSSALTSVYTTVTSASYLWGTYGTAGLKNTVKAMKYMRLSNPDNRNWRQGRLTEATNVDGELSPEVLAIMNVFYNKSNVISQSFSASITQGGESLLPTGGVKRGATNVLDAGMTMYLSAENYSRGLAALSFLLNEEQAGMFKGIDLNNAAEVDAVAAQAAVRLQGIVGDYNPATQGILNHPWVKLPFGLMSEVLHHLKRNLHYMAALYNGGDRTVVKNRAHAAKLIGTELALVTPFLGVSAVGTYKFMSIALGWAMTLFKDDEDQHIPDEVWLSSVMRDLLGDTIYDATTNGLLEQIPYWLLGNSIDISGKFELGLVPFGFNNVNPRSHRSGLSVGLLGPAGTLIDQLATLLDLPNAATPKEVAKIVLESGLFGQTVRRLSTTWERVEDEEVSQISGLITILTGFQDSKLSKTREIDFPYLDHHKKARADFSRAVDAWVDYRATGDKAHLERMLEYAQNNALQTRRSTRAVLSKVKSSAKTEETKRLRGHGSAPKYALRSIIEQKEKRGL